MKSIFVTGTSTGVGKTVVSAVIMKILQGYGIRYWKPVQTGFPPDSDTKTVASLAGLDPSLIIPPYRVYKDPLSPHRAAELEGDCIQYGDFIEKVRSIISEGPVAIEGAGGFLVPLSREFTWGDILEKINIPVIVVANTGLGTINHTLLTVEAMIIRKISIAGIVFLGEENMDNRKTIQAFTGIPDIGRLELCHSSEKAAESIEDVVSIYWNNQNFERFFNFMTED